MSAQLEIRHILGDLMDTATAGFALAFHVRFTTPSFLFQTYPKDWLDYYSQNGLVMSDPTVAWGFENTGAIGWSDLTASDSAGVLAKAAEFGLKHGATCATGSDESRSIGSFARADRDFTDAERAMCMEKLEILHAATSKMRALSPETAAALRTMSVQFTHT
tara:strand:+ start:836 stop:1321 length:486 start_codon:yes stop_codon:yes gene_type:complete